MANAQCVQSNVCSRHPTEDGKTRRQIQHLTFILLKKEALRLFWFAVGRSASGLGKCTSRLFYVTCSYIMPYNHNDPTCVLPRSRYICDASYAGRRCFVPPKVGAVVICTIWHRFVASDFLTGKRVRPLHSHGTLKPYTRATLRNYAT